MPLPLPPLPPLPAPPGPPEQLRRPPVVVIFLLGIVGGLAGTLAAVLKELTHGGLLPAVLAAPAIEEICKPIGVVLILEKRSHWFRSKVQVVLMVALGALVFATLENLMYVHVYNPSGGPGYVVWRYTVCTTMHLAASTIFGLGLARMWQRMRQKGGGFDIDVCLWYYAAAVILHAAYNAIVIILELAKVLRF